MTATIVVNSARPSPALRLLLLAVALVLSAVVAKKTAAQGWQQPMVDFVGEGRQLDPTPRYEVPEAYELASIIVSLTPYGATQVYTSDTSATDDQERAAYALAVREHFGPYADHPAVAAVGFDETDDWYAMYDFRENAYAYRFDSDRPDALIHDAPFSHAWGRADNRFVRNVALVEDFARETGFRAFYAAHRPYYDAVTARDSASTPMLAMQEWLNRTLPREGDSAPPALRVAYSPLRAGWHSTRQFNDAGSALLVMFIEPGLPDPQRAHAFARILFTEIDHNYVNPVSDRYAEALNDSLGFGNPAFVDRSVEGTDGYRSGYDVFNEYMTWVAFELWAWEHYPADVAEAAAEATQRRMEDLRGFARYRAFSDEVLRLYQAGVAVSPDYQLEAMYPALIEWGRAVVSTE